MSKNRKTEFSDFLYIKLIEFNLSKQCLQLSNVEDRRRSVNYYWGLPHKMNFGRVTGYQK